MSVALRASIDAELDRLRGLGWTQEDFARALKGHLLSGDGTEPSNQPVDRIKQLEAALMVLDVTLFCLVASGKVDELFRGQVRAAAEAYKHATGEDSMLVENRCHKDFTKEAASAEGK